MENIFANYDEKFVKAVMLYPDSSNILHTDSATTSEKNLISADDLKNLFIKGLARIVLTDSIVVPVMIEEETTYNAVSVITSTTVETTTTLSLTAYYSDGYSVA